MRYDGCVTVQSSVGTLWAVPVQCFPIHSAIFFFFGLVETLFGEDVGGAVRIKLAFLWVTGDNCRSGTSFIQSCWSRKLFTIPLFQWNTERSQSLAAPGNPWPQECWVPYIFFPNLPGKTVAPMEARKWGSLCSILCDFHLPQNAAREISFTQVQLHWIPFRQKNVSKWYCFFQLCLLPQSTLNPD